MSSQALLTIQPLAEPELLQRYERLPDLYRAALTPAFSGIGVVRQAYDMADFETEILTRMNGFVADDTFDKIRVIAYDPRQSHSIAESLEAHAMHTDASFAKTQLDRFLLHFETVDPAGGGVSTFMPVRWILDALPANHLTALEMASVTYARLGDAGTLKAFRGPILSWRDDEQFLFRWRYDEKVRPMVIDSAGLDAEAAIQWVKNFIDQTPPLYYQAERNETLLIDNRTMLHGRTKLSPNSPRVAWRAWIR